MRFVCEIFFRFCLIDYEAAGSVVIPILRQVRSSRLNAAAVRRSARHCLSSRPDLPNRFSDMNEQPYNNQSLDEYLLGALPAAETERFDELSFTDQGFAAALQAAEQDLVDHYVHGELSGATLEKFKTHYLASPLRREKVEFAANFQIYAKRHRPEKTALPAAQNSETKRGFFSALNIFNAPNPWRQRSYAAVILLLAAFGGWFLIGNFNRQNDGMLTQRNSTAPREPELKTAPNPDNSIHSVPEKETAMTNRETAAPPPNAVERTPTNRESMSKKLPPAPQQESVPQISIASFTLAPSLRGANRIPSFSIPKQTRDVAVQLQLETGDFMAYRVQLVDQTDRKIWRSGSLKSKNEGGGNNNKVLNVRFPAKLLKSQTYLLVVSGLNADGETEIISNYPFRSVLK